RWARHWLDLVRYAETAGHEFDYELDYAWQYRDYVVRALNQDLPYNQFVMEHLAGDLLPEPRRNPQQKFNESLIGTAFYWLGPGKHSPVDLRAEECDRFDNQIDVITKTFLGLTVACARCHDHKFDPFLAGDYYSLYATFAGTVHGPREVSTEQARSERAARLEPLHAEQAKLAQERETFEKELLARAAEAEAEAAKSWTRPKASRYETEETFPPEQVK
ncbi:MAG: DUF1549 domain-containing protein, partial [Planctomycetales bacterium]|nr:DUF1549 domain-containing protein [Planctomycetales bacterium]